MADTVGKPIQCRAAVAWASKEALSIETIEVAPPQPGEVRIRVISSGVCSTDEYTMAGGDPEGVFPAVLGHEGAGIVESVGEGVTSVKAGDHAIPLSTPQCRNCKFCKNPKTNLCQKFRDTQSKGLMPDGTTRFTCQGKELYHFMGCSTFSEYTVCTEISVAKIDEKAPLEKVCLLGGCISTGYGAVLETAKVEPGSKCAVWGVGAVGLAVVMGCVEAGASEIWCVDVDDGKERIAKEFGATHFINPKQFDESVQQVLLDRTDGGLDYTFECIGNIHTMRAALEACHKGWGESIIIDAAAAGQEISTRPFELVTGRVWRGSAFGGWKSRDSVPMLVEKYLDKKLKVDEFVTHNLPLKEIMEGFQLMHTGKSIRTVITVQE